VNALTILDLLLGTIGLLTGKDLSGLAEDKFHYIVGAFAASILPPEKHQLMRLMLKPMRVTIKLGRRS
jgi:hypothetical protein